MITGRFQKRRRRQMRARARTVSINIVSLIDIFAILVFYLLVNALVVEVLPNPKLLKLPESSVQDPPTRNIVLMITPDTILVDNKPVMSLTAVSNTKGNSLGDLKSELYTKPRIHVEGRLTSDVTIGEINILADKSIPYSVLKKVMATCTEARANKISLAVLQKKSVGGEP